MDVPGDRAHGEGSFERRLVAIRRRDRDVVGLFGLGELVYSLGVNSGGWVYLAGHLPFKEDMKSVHVGRVGAEFTAEEASELAKIVGLELVASLKLAVGDLDKVKRIVKVNGFIAVSDGSVTNLPTVLNGCSNLLGEIFEERGVHARVAVGVTTLPLGVPVEIDMIAEVES